MPLLTVKNLKTWYPVRGPLFSKKRFIKAVDDVSFDITPGESLGLVGESGCGKSTLGRTLLQLETATAGEATLAGTDILNCSKRQLMNVRRDIQMIFQDPYGSLNPRMTIFDTLNEVLIVHSTMTPQDRRMEITRLLELVGLKQEQMKRYPHQFSGGQRQRVGIARALAVSPKLIICDECVSALDVRVQAQVITLLKDVQQKCGVSYLFISHDLAVVENLCHRIMVMYFGKVVEIGNAQQVCQQPQHDYTKKLLAAVPSLY